MSGQKKEHRTTPRGADVSCGCICAPTGAPSQPRPKAGGRRVQGKTPGGEPPRLQSSPRPTTSASRHHTPSRGLRLPTEVRGRFPYVNPNEASPAQILGCWCHFPGKGLWSLGRAVTIWRQEPHRLWGCLQLETSPLASSRPERRHRGKDGVVTETCGSTRRSGATKERRQGGPGLKKNRAKSTTQKQLKKGKKCETRRAGGQDI